MTNRRTPPPLDIAGEHVCTRYGFCPPLQTNGAALWQPDIHRCGGLSQMRKIAHMAAADDEPGFDVQSV